MTLIEPKQAVEEYIGEQFIDWIHQYIAQQVSTWSISGKILEARPKIEKIRKFMLQIFLSQEAFLGSREGDPGFLRFIIANLSESNDPQAETALEILEKIRTEELIGHKIEKGIIKTLKREKWVSFLKQIGLTDEEIERAEPKEPTRNYIADLSEIFSTGEWQTAVGAFVAMELTSVSESKIITEFLKINASVEEKDLGILTPSHQSQHLLDKNVFDPETKDLVWQGVAKQLQTRQDFLNALEKYLVD